jgi:hypothetical protein
MNTTEIEFRLDSYLEELELPETPELIKPRWIWNRLPNLSRFDLRDWVKKGFIPSDLIHREHRHTYFTHDGASLASHIWYFREIGFPLRKAAPKAQKFLQQGGKVF